LKENAISGFMPVSGKRHLEMAFYSDTGFVDPGAWHFIPA